MAVLERFEFDSAVWKKLKTYIEDRQAKLREKNDGDHDERKTARLRGQIAELCHIAGLDAVKPLPPPEDELFKD